VTSVSGDGDPPLVTDSDVHALTWEFVNSGYRGDQYANWPIERRRHADNGDICNIILDRIMRSISITAAAAAFDSSGTARGSSARTDHLLSPPPSCGESGCGPAN
jgi:hypothetical protein